MKTGNEGDAPGSNIWSLSAKREHLSQVRRELIQAAGVLLRAMEQLPPSEDEHPVRAAVRRSLGNHLQVIRNAVLNLKQKGK